MITIKCKRPDILYRNETPGPKLNPVFPEGPGNNGQKWEGGIS
jgi:hypothetical protein